MDKHLKIAVFIDFDNIEIGVKSTLQREFDVSIVLEALKERGEIVTKIAYANWGRMENSTRQLSEYAVQMVQRDPSPRGDKNGADINLALDALELAFTHDHINAFAIISGDSDFIALVNKLKQYDKTVFVVGGKAFTSTILQKNCHEFISYESMLDDSRSSRSPREHHQQQQQQAQSPTLPHGQQDRGRIVRRSAPREQREPRRTTPAGRAAPSAGARSASGDAAGGARAAGAGTARSASAAGAAEIDHAAAGFELQRARLRRGIVHRFHREAAQGRSDPGDRRRRPLHDPAQARPARRRRRCGRKRRCRPCATCWKIIAWKWKRASRRTICRLGARRSAGLRLEAYGFQEFSEFLNYAQDKTVVRIEPDEETQSLLVYLGAEFHPPAIPEPEPPPVPEGTGRGDRRDRSRLCPASRPRVRRGSRRDEEGRGMDADGNVIAPPRRPRKSAAPAKTPHAAAEYTIYKYTTRPFGLPASATAAATTVEAATTRGSPRRRRIRHRGNHRG